MFYCTAFILAIYLWIKLIYHVARVCIETENYFPSLGCEWCINSKSYNDWAWMSRLFVGVHCSVC